MTSHFILGAARSGKSRHAAELAAASGADVVVIATAVAGDDETAARIARHRADRPAHWTTVDEPYSVAAAVAAHAADGTTVIVDCLTMWLANLHYGAGRPEQPHSAIDELIAVLDGVAGRVLVISNEIGAGVVPADPASRAFVDDLGRLNQRVAGVCDKVTVVAAGLPLVLKDVR
ncbi:adenosylcobinamide kinase/adenosylcobinamide phosphate guanyltransferase [Gordonia spumicola]|uniref:Adenosylcobinamide kinase n=1 Tax=Gordonia spumicola TaxID=589161 RepID=A0A7I9VB28_9ACTN|nr:bifunctional adenosylcobinamide kinase/adenosylcobinamide-phosphate guanylyltransferase [Gordonia spumicola]GEE02539.1 adenosylcobinamide kinase/adenosylcobinamide phosphate guanyltransferase [Gordonia spumicola]